MTHPPIGSRHRIVVEVEVKGGKITKNANVVFLGIYGRRVVMPLAEFWEAAAREELHYITKDGRQFEVGPKPGDTPESVLSEARAHAAEIGEPVVCREETFYHITDVKPEDTE